jgi:predicted dehydrogenase
MPDVDETTAAVLHFAGDRLATFTSSFDAVDVSTYRIVGTDGEIVVDPAYEYAEPLAYTMTIGETTTRKRGRKLDQFAAELVYFSRCILDDQAPEPSAEEGAWDVRIIDALYESARRGETISLRPFADPGPADDQAITLPPSRPPAPVHAEPPHD